MIGMRKILALILCVCFALSGCAVEANSPGSTTWTIELKVSWIDVKPVHIAWKIDNGTEDDGADDFTVTFGHSFPKTQVVQKKVPLTYSIEIQALGGSKFGDHPLLTCSAWRKGVGKPLENHADVVVKGKLRTKCESTILALPPPARNGD